VGRKKFGSFLATLDTALESDGAVSLVDDEELRTLQRAHFDLELVAVLCAGEDDTAAALAGFETEAAHRLRLLELTRRTPRSRRAQAT
jgi:hypothetical protein